MALQAKKQPHTTMKSVWYIMLRATLARHWSIISKLWKYIVNEYAPNKSIVYYVDLNYFNGRSLDKLCEQFKNMKYITSKYSFKNWYVEEQQMRNRDPKNHQKIKELIDAGFIKTCWDAGSLVYVYNKELSK